MNRLIVSVCLVLGLSAPAFAWETVAEMNRQIDQTNFIVGEGCSGTLISIEKKLVVTAHHCVARQIRQVEREVVGEDGAISKIKVQRLDPVTISQRDYAGFKKVGTLEYVTEIVSYRQERDLALLQLVGDNLRSTQAAPVLPAALKVMRGERVYAVGNPRMLDASITSGVVSSITRAFPVPWALDEPVNFVQFDANIQPGSSGGALFNDQGFYIGTTVAAFPGSDLSLAIPVDDLRNLLSDTCMASVYDPEADDEACEKKAQEVGAGVDASGAKPTCDVISQPGFAPLCRTEDMRLPGDPA